MRIAIFWLFFFAGLYLVHGCERHPMKEIDRETRLSQARYLLTEFGYTPKQIAGIINHS